nr:hypothetical protein [Tanacetum cinerariifolium]
MGFSELRQQGDDVACLVTKDCKRGACELLRAKVDSARSCVMQCRLPTQGMGSIISMVSISPKGFLPSILLLVVVIITVVIVAVILVVIVVVTIIGVVVVVVGGVSFIIKLSLVIIVEDDGKMHQIEDDGKMHQ